MGQTHPTAKCHSAKCSCSQQIHFNVSPTPGLKDYLVHPLVYSPFNLHSELQNAQLEE